MKNVLDFLTAALPYVAIGFWVAFTIAESHAKDAGQKMKMRWGSYFPSAAMVLAAILKFAEGDRSSAAARLVLGVIFLAFSIAQGLKKEH